MKPQRPKGITDVDRIWKKKITLFTATKTQKFSEVESSDEIGSLWCECLNCMKGKKHSKIS